MATEVARIVAKLEADTRDFDRGMTKANAQLGGLDSSAGKASGKLGGLLAAGKKLLPVAAAGFGVAKGLQFFNSAVSAASDLEESVNAVQVQFESGSSSILGFGKIAAKQVGLSNSEFNQLAVTTGALFSGFIKDQDEAAQATIKLTKRAADMASVFNVPVQDALQAVQASLRGEQEPIRRFGVLIDEASVQAKALELGLAATTKELTAQDKSMARLALIYEQTDKVQGDFLNTQDSIANKQRVLAAETENLKAALGQRLAPAMNLALGAANRLATAASNIIGFFDSTVRAANDLNSVMSIVSQQMTRGDADAFTLSNALKELSDRNILLKDNIGFVTGALGANLDVQQQAIAGALGQARAAGESAEKQKVLEDALIGVLLAQDRTSDSLQAVFQAYGIADAGAQALTTRNENLRLANIAAANSSDTLNEAFRSSAFSAAASAQANRNNALSAAEVAARNEQARQSVVALTSAQGAAANPVIRLINANRAASDAQAALTAAQNNTRTSAAELERRILGVVSAEGDVVAARGAVVSALGANIEGFRQMAIRAGISRSEIDKLITKMFGIPRRVGPVRVTLRVPTFFLEQVGSTVEPVATGGSNILLQQGGIATGRTLATIGEGGVKEAVVPLDNRGVGILEDAFRRSGTGGAGNVTVIVEGSVITERDLALTVETQLTRLRKAGAA